MGPKPNESIPSRSLMLGTFLHAAFNSCMLLLSCLDGLVEFGTQVLAFTSLTSFSFLSSIDGGGYIRLVADPLCEERSSGKS